MAKIKSIFSENNKKIKRLGVILGVKTASWDLPAGGGQYGTCPQANICAAHVAIAANGARSLVKGENSQFPCYAAKIALIYPSVHNKEIRNLELSKQDNFVELVCAEIKRLGVKVMRIHSSGDFYNFAYFLKWVEIVKRNPDVQFFAYSKQASFVKVSITNPLPNFKMTYSHGGKMDKWAQGKGLPTCYVITKKSGNPNNVPIACETEYADDYFHVMRQKDFGINVH